jgi:hypothetical protein
MMNLKKRIENLYNSTQVLEVREACLEAGRQLGSAKNSSLTPALQNSFLVAGSSFKVEENNNQSFGPLKSEDEVLAGLIESIQHVDESLTKDFIRVEKRMQGMNNLGVRTSIESIMKEDVSAHPSVRYIIEGLRKMAELPEWLVAERVVESLAQFEWIPVVKENIAGLKENIKTYSEDIKIYKSIYEIKNSGASYLMTTVNESIDNYLNHRTASNRAKLLESLAKYIFNPQIKNLYNVITESAEGFQIKANSNDAYVKTVYSPVHVNEGKEYFVVYGKAYAKTGNDIAPLAPAEIQYLPENFIWMANYINQSNVEIKENTIKIFSRDKKVEIVEEANGTLNLSINGKSVSRVDFEKFYLNSGIFRVEEREVINAVQKIVENWEILFELDFVKSIFSSSNQYRRIDVFSCNEKMHMNKIDTMMKEDEFYANCNATQTRNMVLEFMSYDLGNSLTSVLSIDESHIKELQEKKQNFLDAITYLEARKAKINSIEDSAVRESAEITEIYNAIVTEIQSLKEGYAQADQEIKKYTKASVNEGVGVNVKDEVEVVDLKKKQQ